MPSKKKASKRPCRHPSAARIAVQKIILKTKGLKIEPNPSRQTPNQTRLRKRKLEIDNSPATLKILSPQNAASSGGLLSTPPSTLDTAAPKRKYGLKITHHGISRGPPTKKLRSCRCEMCGDKFMSSTLFIDHYSTTHLTLPCPDCDKIYSNPLSLQKHCYFHMGNMKKCPDCDKCFPFELQLSDHLKTHLNLKQYICSHPKCKKDFTHKYHLAKHKWIHTKKDWCCTDCDYVTKDERNFKQHRRVHTWEKPYTCVNCAASFTFFMQKKRHKCKTN